MPDPTKEQFDAAAKRVMETAPPGLSREQFFAAIDAELSPARSIDPMHPPSTRGPHGYPTDELGQEYDPKTVAPYQPGIFQRGVDYLSNVLTHPTPGQQLAGDVAAVLAGRFAGGMRPGAMDTQNELTLRGEGLKGYAQSGLQKLADWTGLDSDARDIKALNLRKAALRSSAKQIKTAGDIADAQAPAVSLRKPSAPPETPSAATRATAAPTAEDGQVLEALQRDGLSPAEAQQALKWRQQGWDLQKIHDQIELSRQLNASGTFAGLAGPEEAAAQAETRAATSRARSTRLRTPKTDEP